MLEYENTTRQTKQRSLVLDIVKDSCDHPSAEMVYERAKKVMPAISLGTVYRNLAQLSQSGQILRIKVDNGDRFDKTVCIHAHFHCAACNKVTDIAMEQAAAFALDVESEAECRVDKCDILFSGICKECL